jgi:hypothetical protein
MPLGKVRRGSFNPFDLKEEMSHFVRHDDKWGGKKSPPPIPPKNDFMNLEKSWGTSNFVPNDSVNCLNNSQALGYFL